MYDYDRLIYATTPIYITYILEPATYKYMNSDLVYFPTEYIKQTSHLVCTVSRVQPCVPRLCSVDCSLDMPAIP